MHALLDDDDESLPAKLERQLWLARKLNCLASCCNAVRIIPGETNQENYLCWKLDRIRFEDLLLVNQVICSSSLVHRSFFLKAEGFPEDADLKALEDYAFLLRVASLTDFAFISEPLVRYLDDAKNGIRKDNVDVCFQKKQLSRIFCIGASITILTKDFFEKLEFF